MTAEHRERNLTETIFPLGTDSVHKALDWMEDNAAPTNPEYGKNVDEFWKDRGELFVFVKDLKNFRKIAYQWNVNNTRSYERGIMYGAMAVDAKYKNNTSSLTQDHLRDYFESMLGLLENTTENAQTRERLGLEEEDRVNPGQLVTAITQNRLPKEVQERVVKAFIANTTGRLTEMRNDFSFLYFVRTPWFYNKFGPAQGLAHGAFDMYQIYCSQEKKESSINLFERMWDIEVK